MAGLLMAGSLNSLAIGNNNTRCQPLLSLLYYRFSAMFPWRLILIGSMPIPLPMPVDWLETVRNLQKIFKVDNNSPFTECVLR